MTLDFAENNSSSVPVSYHDLSDAHKNSLYALTDDTADQLSKINHATGLIATSRLIFAESVAACADDYEEWWLQERIKGHPIVPDNTFPERMFDNLDDRVERLYTVILRSFVFSDLQIDSVLMLETGRALHRPSKWIQDQVDINSPELRYLRDGEQRKWLDSRSLFAIDSLRLAAKNRNKASR